MSGPIQKLWLTPGLGLESLFLPAVSCCSNKYNWMSWKDNYGTSLTFCDKALYKDNKDMNRLIIFKG